MDCSPSGSSVHEIFQAEILEQIAISYSEGPFWPRDQTLVVSGVSSIGRWILYHFTTSEDGNLNTCIVKSYLRGLRSESLLTDED